MLPATAAVTWIANLGFPACLPVTSHRSHQVDADTANSTTASTAKQAVFPSIWGGQSASAVPDPIEDLQASAIFY